MRRITMLMAVIVLTVFVILSCKTKSSPSSPDATATPAGPVLTPTITPTHSVTGTITPTATVTVTVTPTATNAYATISGSIMMPADQTGKGFQVLVDTNMDFTDGFYMKAGTCPAGTNVPYSVTGPAGTYYVYAVVKLQSTSLEPPKAGDYVGIYDGTGTATWPDQVPQTVTVLNGEDKTVNIKVDLAQLNVNGTITLSSPVTDLKAGIVVLDADKDPSNGFFSTEAFFTGSGQGTYAYNLLALFPGTYYIYGFVDVDGSGVTSGPNPGDFVGDANGGAAINITNVHIGLTGSPYDFTLSLKP